MEPNDILEALIAAGLRVRPIYRSVGDGDVSADEGDVEVSGIVNISELATRLRNVLHPSEGEIAAVTTAFRTDLAE